MTMLTRAIHIFLEFFCRLNMLPVSSFENFLCPGSDDGSSSNKSGRWNVSEVYCQ